MGEEGGDMEQGACSSDEDCPPSDPVCSEFGFCQCESYNPGDAECWQGSQEKGNREAGSGNQAEDQERGGGEAEKEGIEEADADADTDVDVDVDVGEQGFCSSDADCPASDPVCSEYGFCQCESYQPGDSGCWQGSEGGGGEVGKAGGAQGGFGGGGQGGQAGGAQGGCTSDADCPSSDPVCSEFGFCQCAA